MDHDNATNETNETNETREISGGDPVKAIVIRWTLDRLYKHPDLTDRVMREGYKLAWAGLSLRGNRKALIKALAANPEVREELTRRTGMPVVLP
jgi:hypothetical protein